MNRLMSMNLYVYEDVFVWMNVQLFCIIRITWFLFHSQWVLWECVLCECMWPPVLYTPNYLRFIYLMISGILFSTWKNCLSIDSNKSRCTFLCILVMSLIYVWERVSLNNYLIVINAIHIKFSNFILFENLLTSLNSLTFG